MTIKFNRNAANQYLSASDAAAQTFPDGDWVLSGVAVIDGLTTADNPQYFFSTGGYQAAGAVNVLYQTAGNASPNYLQVSIGSITLGSIAKFLAGSALVWVVQRSAGTVSLRTCLIKTAAPSDGTGVSLDGSVALTGALDGPSGLYIGGRGDLNTSRLADQSLGRTFRYDGTLTDLEVAKLAYGMEITDLGKTPAWYVRMNDVSDITDRGTQANTITPHGAIATGTAPGFGYTASNASPVISGTPTIVNGASVGSASSVTPASVTGSPTPTNSYQWKIDGAAVSGATGTTYTPISSDAGKTLTVTQTASNGVGTPATATSPGVVVTAAVSTIDVTQITAERIFQRISTSASIPMAGTYTSTTPTSIEYQLYAEDGTTILLPWVVITGATISGGNWSGVPAVPQGGMYRLSVRSKSGSTVLATTNIKANLFGVGDLIACFGSSSPQFWFASDSGTGYTPAANVRAKQVTTWYKMGTDGSAIQMANAFAAQAGVPIGMLGYGVGGTTLADALGQTNRVWTEFAAAMAEAGKIKSCVVSTGSNDAANGAVQSRAAHAANLRQLITNIRGLTSQPTLDICLSGFNRRPAVSNQQADFVRMAENDVVAGDAHVAGVQLVDLALRDDLIHLTTTSFPISTQRITYQVIELAYKGIKHASLKITSFTYAGSTIYANLQHGDGTDITPTTAINGFTASDASGALTITGARTAGNRIALTATRAVAPPVAPKYLSGSSPVSQTITAPANEVFDNSSYPMPLLVETDMAATAESVPDTTPPTLTAASATTTGPTTASGSVTTNEAGGTLYYLASTSATATSAQVKAGASQAVSATGAQSVSLAGLSPTTQYYPHYLQTDAAGNDSAVLDGAAFTTQTPADVTAPTLSAATAAPNGAYAATGAVTTNEGNGTLYYLASTSVSLTATQVKAGSTQAISSAGTKGVAVNSLAAATIYYLHFLHRDAAGNDSAVLRSASFTTAAAPTNPSTIDATKVPASRTVTFPGNKRVVTF